MCAYAVFWCVCVYMCVFVCLWLCVYSGVRVGLCAPVGSCVFFLCYCQCIFEEMHIRRHWHSLWNS